MNIQSINPEAGQHPVPSDPRELDAAVRAGDLCWQRFPYYAARYGERGLRFARSDAAWQATLVHYPAGQILQQVRWLGRVLAGRGMPTLLLQVQLEILVDALSASLPEKRADYMNLLPAAEDLRATRALYLSDEAVNRLAEAFDDAVGPDLSQQLPGTGQLLCAALADELAGSEKAVHSLHVWMADAARFPARWVSAVDDCLAQARQHAAKLGGSCPHP